MARKGTSDQGNSAFKPRDWKEQGTAREPRGSSVGLGQGRGEGGKNQIREELGH